MKKILLLLLFILLTSCGRQDSARHYLMESHELHVTYSHGGIDTDGRLLLSPEQIVFCPDSHNDLSITLNAEGGEVRFGDMSFGSDVAEFTRLMPLYEEMTEGSLILSFDGKAHPHTIQGKNFKITVHKEICK